MLEVNQKIKNLIFQPFYLIIIAGVIVYGRALFYGYTFDDGQLIIQNQQHLVGWRNVANAFIFNPYWKTDLTFYRPVLTLSFMLDHLIGSVNPLIYHLSNLIYHLISCCLLYAALLCLGSDRNRAVLWGVIFAVHPVLSQAVAWIPGRNDTLLTMFSLSAFISLIKFAKTNDIKLLVGHVLFYVLALLTKETAILLPVLFIIFWFWLAGRSVKSGHTAILVIGWFTLSLAYLLLRAQIFGFQKTQFYSIQDCLTGLMSYYGKCLFPFNLSVMPVNTDINIYYGLGAILLTVILFACGKIRDMRLFVFGLIWTLIFILPAFIAVTDFPNFMEQRIYLPATGIALYFDQLEFRIKEKKYLPLAEKAAVLMVVLVFGCVNIKHNGVFSDASRFWKNAAMTSPRSYFVHYMLGQVYLSQNDQMKAEQEFNRTLSLNKNAKWAYDKLANIYEKRKLYAQAEKMYSEVLNKYPDDPILHNNYGSFYINQGLWDKAEEELLKAETYIAQSTKETDIISINYNMALVDYANMKYVMSRDRLLKISTLPSSDHRISELLSSTYLQLGEIELARKYYKQAVALGLSIDPEAVKALKMEDAIPWSGEK
jgi:Flp pilus assembly protein TadD